MRMPRNNANGKISFADFAKRFISHARGVKSKGIHTVYDKFNDTARAYYGKQFNVVEATNALVDKGIIEGYITKGGMRIYLKGEMPQSGKTVESLLESMDLSL